jgi:hypothetical protein
MSRQHLILMVEPLAEVMYSTGCMKPPNEFTGPLNVVFAMIEILRVIAHPCIVSITSARSVDTSKKFLDVP